MTASPYKQFYLTSKKMAQEVLDKNLADAMGYFSSERVVGLGWN